MKQPNWELMKNCEQSILTVLRRSRSISHEREYFPGNMEANCASQIFLEIANKRRSLINPVPSNNRISLHSQFQISGLTRRQFKTGQLDIAIVRRAKRRPGREIWGEYLYDLIGVIEVKRNFRQELDKELERLRTLLATFPNAFGILVVTYWNRTEKETENVRRVMSRVKRWKAWKDSKINLFCERNVGKDNVNWNGEVLDGTGILKASEN